MVEALGRRETNKAMTRQALQDAAEQLFAAHGYEATTVRDIAEAAGVTERTFFRYFAGKHDLVVDQVLAWLPVLQERIRQRPVEEDPLTAVKAALLKVDRRIAAASKPAPVWLFRDGPPVGQIPKTAPSLLLRVESALSEAIRDRLEATGGSGEEDIEYLADTYARVSLALMRSILIRDWQLRQRNRRPRRSLASLAEQAFTAVQTD